MHDIGRWAGEFANAVRILSEGIRKTTKTADEAFIFVKRMRGLRLSPTVPAMRPSSIGGPDCIWSTIPRVSLLHLRACSYWMFAKIAACCSVSVAGLRSYRTISEQNTVPRSVAHRCKSRRHYEKGKAAKR